MAYSDAATYRVIVSQSCSGASAASSNAVLTVLAPWTFCTWDNGGGDNLASNPNNWNPDKMPSVQDFCGDFITSLLIINTNLSVDTFRTGGGGTVLHTNGTLTIVNGIWTDNGFWAGEFGANCAYTLDGGKIVVLDPNDGFMVGRNLDSQSTFTLLSGNVTNTLGDTHIGLDGVATWNQSGGVFKAAGVQIGRFASSNATVNLSGTAQWDSTLVLLADGHGADFTPIYGAGNRNPNPVNLNLIGPSVNYHSVGLVMMQEGNLTFDGAGSGISTMDLGGGIFLINGGEFYVINPPTPAALGQEVVLMRNIGSHLVNDQFNNAPQGTVYSAPCGGQWTLNYRPLIGATNIVLVASTLPATVNITGITVSSGTVAVKFSAGASDTAGCFELWGSSTVNGTYSNLGAVITSLGSGNFQTSVSVAGASHFYRIRRL